MIRIRPRRIHGVPDGDPVYWCPMCNHSYGPTHGHFDLTAQTTLHVFRLEDL